MAIYTFNSISDTVRPDLECPDNVYVPIPYWQAGTLVTYPSAVASDNVGVKFLSYTKMSGHFFHKGETLVTVTAEDFSGNRAYCEFKVTVYVSGE